MIYEYTCHTCGAVWEQNMTMADRDKPVGQPCPMEDCKEGKIARGITAPGISYEGAMSPIRRAGSGWNDVLKGIKKKKKKKGNTINHY